MPKSLLGDYTWAGSREGLVGRPIQRLINVGSTSTLVVGANPHRRAIIFSNLDPTSLIFLFLNGAAATQQGILLPPGMKPVFFSSYWWGKLAEAEFRAIATLNGTAEGIPTRNSQAATGLSGATTGIKQSFQVPAGSVGVLRSATYFPTVGAPTVNLQIVRGANTINLENGTVQVTVNSQVDLQALDTVQWNVTTAVAASTFDATISVDTFTGIGAAPTAAPLGVWELED